MSIQAQELANKLEAAIAEAATAIERCSPDQWRARTSAEGWSVGVTAHHLASSVIGTLGLVQAVALGQPLPPLTQEMLDGGNAQHAVAAANCTQAETLEILRKDGPGAVAFVKGLSDAQLNMSAPLAVMGGALFTAAQLADHVLIGHVQGHLSSVMASA